MSLVTLSLSGKIPLANERLIMFERGSQMRPNYDLSTFLRSCSGRELNASHLKEEMNAVFKFSVVSVLFNPKERLCRTIQVFYNPVTLSGARQAALRVAVRVVSRGIYSSSFGKKNNNNLTSRSREMFCGFRLMWTKMKPLANQDDVRNWLLVEGNLQCASSANAAYCFWPIINQSILLL